MLSPGRMHSSSGISGISGINGSGRRGDVCSSERFTVSTAARNKPVTSDVTQCSSFRMGQSETRLKIDEECCRVKHIAESSFAQARSTPCSTLQYATAPFDELSCTWVSDLNIGILCNPLWFGTMPARDHVIQDAPLLLLLLLV
jgi:hypothetical protein